MGCDIHLFTEMKKSVYEKDVWVNVDRWTINPYYIHSEDKEKDYERPLDVDSIYQGRNYELFGILAGVRSGLETPIQPPRGLPGDVSQVIKMESDKWGRDGHTHSYLTLSEMVDYYNQNQQITYDGMVTPEEASELDLVNGEPDGEEYVSELTGFVYRQWKEDSPLKHLIEQIKKRYKDETWIDVDSQTEEDYKKIRVVFWFDN